MIHWQLSYVLVTYVGLPTLYVGWMGALRRRRRTRWERACRLRNERLHHIAVGTGPFHPGLVPMPERQGITGRSGLNSQQWYDVIVADFRAMRCDRLPTCADYRREFGDALTRFYYTSKAFRS